MAKAKISIHLGGLDPDFDKPSSINVFTVAAGAIAALARERGYEARVLAFDAATKTSILAAFEAAARDLDQNGEFLLTYCGHGFRRVPGCTEQDTQSWRLSDWQPSEDVVRRKLLSQFSGTQRVLVINDSCYAGNYGNFKKVTQKLNKLNQESLSDEKKNQLTIELMHYVATHFPGYSLRSLKELMATPVDDDCAGGKDPACPVMLLQASSSGKVATKALFTNTLIALLSAKTPATYASLIAKAREQMGDQKPEINGAEEAFADRPPFGN